MADWTLLPASVTSSGQPRQFWMKDNVEVFVMMAERRTGGPDSNFPRRVVAVGSERASARVSLVETIKSYDPMGVLRPSR